MRVLVVDIGGTRVKVHQPDGATDTFDSGASLTPTLFMQEIRTLLAEGGDFEVVSIGYPGAVGPQGPARDPGNLGTGWVGFNFEHAFERPVRVVNDAILQALGNYEGGRMLFLGLGTGLGSALVIERVVVPLELGSLRYDDTNTIADIVGAKGLDALGEETWRARVDEVISMLRAATAADTVALGGGNAARISALPEATRRGRRDAARTGGQRLWEHTVEPHDRPPSNAWRIVS